MLTGAMPLPAPIADETRDAFIGRCMGDPALGTEFPDKRQRLAVCVAQFARARKHQADEDDAVTFEGESCRTSELLDEARDYGYGGHNRTSVRQFHWHSYDGGAEFTEPPCGVPDGHRHRILRDDEGIVTGFEASADHGHGVPEENAPPSRAEDMQEAADATRAMSVTGWSPDDRWAVSGAINPTQALGAAVFAERDDLFDLQGVEIFRAGEWNGDKYSRADLDEMVRNFDRVGYRPPVKLGHKAASGAPASGWVKSIRRVGDRLVADLMDLPKQIYEAIKGRRFDAVSAEIFWNLKRSGKTFKRALKAIALLGAETPAVSGLKPLRESFSAEDLRHVHVYATSEHVATSEDETMGDDAKLEEMQAELEKLKAEKASLEQKLSTHDDDKAAAVRIQAMAEEIKELKVANQRVAEERRGELIEAKCHAVKIPALRSHFYALYDLASRAKEIEEMRVVKFSSEDDDGNVAYRDTEPMAVVDDLAKRLNQRMEILLAPHTAHLGRADRDAAIDSFGEADPSRDPGEIVDEKARDYIAKHPETDYRAAVHAVLEQPGNRQLKAAYAGRGRVQ